MNPLMAAAFLDELTKIAFADSHMAIPKSREGRRPISVDKLLDKDKRGEIYKSADSQGNPQDIRDGGDDDPGAAQPKPHAGEPPSKERGERGNIPVGRKYGMVQGGSFAEGATPIPGGEFAPSSYLIEATPKRGKGDVPSLDDVNNIERFGKKASLIGALASAPTAYDFMKNGPEAKRPRKKGDVPTRDDGDALNRYDQRENATTVSGLGQNSTDIATSNHPGEHP